MPDLAPYGLAALLGVMLAKELGFPVPIPSDLLMIAAGVQAAVGIYPLPQLALGMLVAVAVGASLQFLLIRRVGRSLVYRLGPRFGLRPERLDSASAKLRASGPFGIFLGLNVPGARAGIVPAAPWRASPIRRSRQRPSAAPRSSTPGTLRSAF